MVIVVLYVDKEWKYHHITRKLKGKPVKEPPETHEAQV